MNTLINQYLQNMDFFISFHLDEEFNETVKSRFRDTFNYNNFSEGEKNENRYLGSTIYLATDSKNEK